MISTLPLFLYAMADPINEAKGFPAFEIRPTRGAKPIRPQHLPCVDEARIMQTGDTLEHINCYHSDTEPRRGFLDIPSLRLQSLHFCPC